MKKFKNFKEDILLLGILIGAKIGSFIGTFQPKILAKPMNHGASFVLAFGIIIYEIIYSLEKRYLDNKRKTQEILKRA